MFSPPETCPSPGVWEYRLIVVCSPPLSPLARRPFLFGQGHRRLVLSSVGYSRRRFTSLAVPTATTWTSTPITPSLPLATPSPSSAAVTTATTASPSNQLPASPERTSLPIASLVAACQATHPSHPSVSYPSVITKVIGSSVGHSDIRHVIRSSLSILSLVCFQSVGLSSVRLPVVRG